MIAAYVRQIFLPLVVRIGLKKGKCKICTLRVLMKALAMRALIVVELSSLVMASATKRHTRSVLTRYTLAIQR